MPWSEYIAWNGTQQPVENGTSVWYVDSAGSMGTANAESLNWNQRNTRLPHVMCYKVFTQPETQIVKIYGSVVGGRVVFSSYERAIKKSHDWEIDITIEDNEIINIDWINISNTN